MPDPRPLVSIIIPCFNQGKFVAQAVDSVLASDYQNLEIVIVDDGSDEETRREIDRLQRPKTRVFRHDNQGAPTARNKGILEARGVYIMPLDADDLIERSFISKAVDVLDHSPTLGFVYATPRLFGVENGVWKLPSYNFYTLLWDNQIPVCALIRKQAWQEAGGYNPNMGEGNEDWDFWVSLGEKGWYGRLIPEQLFFHRRTRGSRTGSALLKRRRLIRQLHENHQGLYRDRSRLRQLRREWHVCGPCFHMKILAKELWRMPIIPMSARESIRAIFWLK